MKGVLLTVFLALLLIPALATAQSQEIHDPDEVYQSDPQGTVPPYAPNAVL